MAAVTTSATVTVPESFLYAFAFCFCFFFVTVRTFCAELDKIRCDGAKCLMMKNESYSNALVYALTVERFRFRLTSLTVQKQKHKMCDNQEYNII